MISGWNTRKQLQCSTDGEHPEIGRLSYKIRAIQTLELFIAKLPFQHVISCAIQVLIIAIEISVELSTVQCRHMALAWLVLTSNLGRKQI